MPFSPMPRPSACLGLVLLTALLIFAGAGCGPGPKERFQAQAKAGAEFFARHDYAQAALHWEQALSAPGITAPLDIYLRLADAYVRLAEPEKALSVLTAARDLYPSNNDLLLQTAELELFFADLDQAAQRWESGIKDMNTPASLVFGGDLASLNNDLALAERRYRAALHKDKDNQMALARLALCLAGRNQNAEAAATLEHLLRLSPNPPLVLLQIGNFHRLTGDHARAEDFYRKAVAADKGSLVLLKNLAEFYFFLQRYQEAEAAIEQGLSKEPRNPALAKLRAELLMRANRFDEAAATIERLAEQGALDIETLLLRGKYYLLTGKPNFAISQFSEAIKKENGLALSHYWLAMSYFADNKNNLAQQSAIKALSLNPNFTPAELLLADIYISKGETDTAREHITRVLRREPEAPRPYMLAGSVALLEHRWEQAYDLFRKAALLRPGRVAPAYYSAIALERSGKRDQALAIYRSFLSKATRYPDVARRFVAISLDTQDFSRVEQDLLDNAPAEQAAYYHEILGCAALARGKEDYGVRQLKQAIALSQDRPLPYLRLADYYNRQKKWGLFEKTLRSCLDNNPGNIDAILKLSGHYGATGRINTALALVDQGLRAHPDSPVLAGAKAWLLLESGDNLDQAFILAQKTYDLLPGNPAAADTLGWAYYRKNMLTRATWLIEEARRLAPSAPMPAFHLAMVKLAGNNKREAEALFREALASGLPSPYRRQALELADDPQAPLKKGGP